MTKIRMKRDSHDKADWSQWNFFGGGDLEKLTAIVADIAAGALEATLDGDPFFYIGREGEAEDDIQITVAFPFGEDELLYRGSLRQTLLWEVEAVEHGPSGARAIDDEDKAPLLDLVRRLRKLADDLEHRIENPQ